MRRLERFALADAPLATIMVYVCVVTPSGAVTSTVIVVGPTLNPTADAVPDVAGTLFMVIVAAGSLAVGIMFTDAVL